MNEQELLLKEKIDIILAYILIAILLGCIVLVIVLKFTKNENNEVEPDEYIPNYISLTNISNSLNMSVVAGKYDGFTSSVSGNSIDVMYNDGNINIPMVGNELMFTITEDNSEIVTDIYKEVASTICVYYGNQEVYCRNTLDNMSDTGNDSIRIVSSGNNNVVYVDITKSYTVSEEIVYNDITKVDFNETNYVLNMSNYRIYDINIVTTNDNVLFNGKIKRSDDDNTDVSVVVKLYDIDDNIIGENKYEYNESNVMENEDSFEINLLINDDLKFENINKYSIEITK